MDWKEELLKKKQQLNQEEDINVQSGIVSGGNSGNSVGRGRGIHLSERNRKIQVNITTNGERGERMISAEAALGDYEKIINTNVDTSGNPIDSNGKMVLIMRIIIKLLLTIRSNQMGGIKKIDPKVPVTQK